MMMVDTELKPSLIHGIGVFLLEPVRRGVYCGAFGWIDTRVQEADLAVAIRTFTVHGAGDDGCTRLGVGGGIVADSHPAGEWDETCLKAARLLAAAGAPAPALVGEDGELEHAAALLHPELGGPFRSLLGGGAALIPSSKKRGAVGAPFDIPLGHKDAARVRSHFDGMEVRVPDGPRADEIAVAIAVTDSGRPLPRVGGLTKGKVKGVDGLV